MRISLVLGSATMCILRVAIRFFGIRDLAYFKAGSRDLGLKKERDSGL